MKFRLIPITIPMSYCNENKRFFAGISVNFSLTYLNEKMKFSVVLLRKQALGQLFVEDVYIFLIISFSLKESDRKIADLFFFSFMVMRTRSLTS